MKGFRIQTPAERQELLLISRLQRMNCYEQLVRRLTEGESANSVSRWASGLKVDGAAGNWSYLYWRKHIMALAKHVRRAKDKLRTRKPVLPQPDAVAARVEMQMADLLAEYVIPKSVSQVWRHVDKTLKQIDAEHILKYACVRQMERVEKLMELEEKLLFLTPNGYKEIDALRQIADSIRKIEVGEQLLRGRGGNMPFAALPPEASIEAPSDIEEPREPTLMEKQFDELDEVEKNRHRAAVARVIEMIENGSGGRY